MPTPPPNAYTPGTILTVGLHQAMIGKYISEGGFAHVYLVQISPPSNGLDVACLKRVLVPNKATLNVLRAEVDAMKRLQGSPCIVSYIDSHAARSAANDGTYEVFLLMEYCSRKGLIDFLNTRLQNRLTEPEILQIMYEVTIALSQVHFLSPPLIHRDIKIENVLINERGEYKLCDFGSSCAPLRPPRTPQEVQILQNDIQHYTTAQYRAPEMIDFSRGLPIDEKSDIWALGVFCYKICYYTTPFEHSGEAAILRSEFSFPPYPPYSPRLQNLITVLLTNDARLRPDIYQVLEEVCKMKNVPVPVEIQKQYAAYKERRRAKLHASVSPMPVVQPVQQPVQQPVHPVMHPAIQPPVQQPAQPPQQPAVTPGSIAVSQKPVQSVQSGKSIQSGKSVQSGKSIQSGKSGKSVQSVQSNKSLQSLQPVSSKSSTFKDYEPSKAKSLPVLSYSALNQNYATQGSFTAQPMYQKPSNSDPFAGLVAPMRLMELEGKSTSKKQQPSQKPAKVAPATAAAPMRSPFLPVSPQSDIETLVIDVDMKRWLRGAFDTKPTPKPSKQNISATKPVPAPKPLAPTHLSNLVYSEKPASEIRRSQSFHKRTISAGKTGLNKLSTSLTGKFRSSLNNSRLSSMGTGRKSPKPTPQDDIDQSEDEMISDLAMKEYTDMDYIKKSKPGSTVQRRMEMLLSGGKDEVVKTASGYGKYTDNTDLRPGATSSRTLGTGLIRPKRTSLDLSYSKKDAKPNPSSAPKKPARPSSLVRSLTGPVKPAKPAKPLSPEKPKKLPPPRPKKPAHLVSPKVKGKEWTGSSPTTANAFFEDDGEDDDDTFDVNDFEISFNEKFPKID